ncbi:MAG: hypothetical protein E7354_02540 [Clostridiales bacterium]|nr:hypothetical protein [Clostridiales bacterium]
MSGVFERIKEHLNRERMKTVYRFISERERQALENSDISQIGSLWQSNDGRSNHKYRENTRYIHFVDSIQDANDIYNALKDSKAYLCSYSIPTSVLKKYVGKGYYPPHGYDYSYTEIKEYAIPSEEFDFSWLISIQSVEEFLNKKDTHCK